MGTFASTPPSTYIRLCWFVILYFSHKEVASLRLAPSMIIVLITMSESLLWGKRYSSIHNNNLPFSYLHFAPPIFQVLAFLSHHVIAGSNKCWNDHSMPTREISPLKATVCRKTNRKNVCVLGKQGTYSSSENVSMYLDLQSLNPLASVRYRMQMEKNACIGSLVLGTSC